MFCKFCGKPIADDAQFCPYCGGSLHGEKRISVNVNIDSLRSSVQKFMERTNLNRLAMLLTTAFLALSFLVRFTKQEITTVVNFLAYDDYYVITGAGRVWIILFVMMQNFSLFLLHSLGNKKEQTIQKKAYIYAAIATLIEIVLLFIKIPAPY